MSKLYSPHWNGSTISEDVKEYRKQIIHSKPIDN